jgi:hypothetical protein
MYQLRNTIHAGIQCGHAAMEYVFEFINPKDPCWEFIKDDKTWVILNGGTSNHSNDYKIGINNLSEFNDQNNLFIESDDLGTMEQHWNYMTRELPFVNKTLFFEPDMNNALTSICFIVPNIIFNRKDYPDFDKWILNTESQFDLEPLNIDKTDLYKYWVNDIMQGENNVKFRDFLNKFNLL